MSASLAEGIFFFNQARYFEAHEIWEDLWRVERGEHRLLYQGLIQAAVGLHHLSRGNATGGRAQLSKSLAKLDLFPAGTQGIALDRLCRDLRNLLENMDLEALPAIRIVVESQGTF